MPRILVVDDDSVFLTLLTRLLSQQGFDTVPAANGQEALDILQSSRFELMISDISMLPVDGMELLHRAREAYADMGIILLTANGSIDTALDAMKNGAFDYLTKPFKVNELLNTVQHALEYQQTAADAPPPVLRLSFCKHVERIRGIVTECPAMLTVCDQIRHFAPTDFTILICGERGSGKTLVACDLHRYSPRRSRPLRAVNCAALEPEQLDAALKAVTDGTILLERIGSLSPELQTRLLEWLRDQAVTQRRSGKLSTSARILITASQDLQELTEQGRFHPGLYQQLCAVRIMIPPMRQRPEDLLPIISQTLHQKLGDDAGAPMLDSEAEAVLTHYTWPGNVRELEDSILYALASIESGPITKASLPPHIVEGATPHLPDKNSAARGARYKARSLKAFLREKEKELLAHLRDRVENPVRAAALRPCPAAVVPVEEKVTLVEKKALYYPPRRLD